jgi:hypothetical protein
MSTATWLVRPKFTRLEISRPVKLSTCQPGHKECSNVLYVYSNVSERGDIIPVSTALSIIVRLSLIVESTVR